ncbi:MAG: 4Fe-4S dicluster domain-containing protein, partial [Candidatus Hodarchaeota archaeon]
MTKDSLRKAIEQCVNCGKCRVKCPTLDANEEGTPYWEIFGPRGRMLLSKGILNDEVKITERLHDGLFTCFFCNQCVEDCPSHIPITEVLVETRKHLVEKGDAPTKVLESHDTINDSKNLFGMDQEDRVDLWSMDVEELLEGRINVPADILYFIGCQAAFRGTLAKIAVRMVQIMDKLELNFTILGEDEVCCGD